MYVGGKGRMEWDFGENEGKDIDEANVGVSGKGRRGEGREGRRW